MTRPTRPTLDQATRAVVRAARKLVRESSFSMGCRAFHVRSLEAIRLRAAVKDYNRAIRATRRKGK